MGPCGPLTFTGDLAAQSGLSLRCAVKGGLKSGPVGKRAVEAEAGGPRNAGGGGDRDRQRQPRASLPGRYRNFRTFTSPRPTQFSCVAVDLSGELVSAGAQDSFEIFIWSMQTGRLLEVSRSAQAACSGGPGGWGPHATCHEGTSEWPKGAGGVEVTAGACLLGWPARPSSHGLGCSEGPWLHGRGPHVWSSAGRHQGAHLLTLPVNGHRSCLVTRGPSVVCALARRSRSWPAPRGTGRYVCGTWWTAGGPQRRWA